VKRVIDELEQLGWKVNEVRELDAEEVCRHFHTPDAFCCPECGFELKPGDWPWCDGTGEHGRVTPGVKAWWFA